VPINRPLIDQLQIRLVDQRGRLQGVTAFVGEPSSRKLFELGVYGGDQRFYRSAITATPREK
jgi:hypothetical protein